MYKCKTCGNKTRFLEKSFIYTEVVLNPDNGRARSMKRIGRSLNEAKCMNCDEIVG